MKVQIHDALMVGLRKVHSLQHKKRTGHTGVQESETIWLPSNPWGDDRIIRIVHRGRRVDER